MSERECKDELEVHDLGPEVALARRMADAAAEATLANFRNDIAIDDKGSDGNFDPVTEADRGAERAMRALIEAECPEDGIVGEEFGSKPGRSGRTWVLDPVDGTRAFIAGLPTWGTLIALNDGSRPVLGVLSQPYLGETFIGMSLEGRKFATLNGRRIRTRRCDGLDRAIISTTGLNFFTDAERTAYLAVERDTRIARYGFDCYAYAILAAGFIDLVVEAGLKPHDIQALIPLIEGAGGCVTGWRGEDAQHGGRILAAGDERLHAQAMERLAGLD